MKKKGFTVLELILVIAVMGILAIIALPKIIDVRTDATLSVAQHFGGALKEARDLYFSRLLLETGGSPPTPVNAFFQFVALSNGATDRNTINVDNSLRNLFQNPNADVLQGNGSLLFTFKNGGTATYQIDGNGRITEQYAGF